MERKKVNPAGPELSRIITGVWRWENLTDQETQRMIELVIERLVNKDRILIVLEES